MRMTKRLSILLMVSTVALLVFTGCQKGETPVPAPSAAEKPSTPAPETPACSDCIAVNADNFVRAESDLYFSGQAIKREAFGKFVHERTPHQSTIRQ